MVQVGVYSEQEVDGTRYMTVANPLPWSNLSAVVTFSNSENGGLKITTGDDDSPEAGMYLSTPFCPVRLPMDESLCVKTADGDCDEPEDTDVVVGHEILLLGRNFAEFGYLGKRH